MWSGRCRMAARTLIKAAAALELNETPTTWNRFQNLLFRNRFHPRHRPR